MPASPKKSGKAVKPLQGLDMKEKENKKQYRIWVAWLKKHGLSLGAHHLWNSLGASDDPSLENIRENIRGLETILPVYMEALLGLCEEEATAELNPLNWWHAFSKDRLKTDWFAKIFPRLPEELIDYRNHEREYYLMENQTWMKRAAVAILKMDFQTPIMLLLLAANEEEFHVMKTEIDLDDREEERRLKVCAQVAFHRLTSHDENHNMDASEVEIQKMFPDEQADTQWIQTVFGARRQKLLMAECATKVDGQYDMESIFNVISNQQEVMDHMIHLFEVVRTGHCLLKRDIQAHFKSSGSEGSGKEKVKDEPAWWLDCKPTVYKLLSKDGMKFESNGVTESEHQKKGRKQRDDVYERFARPWRVLLSYLHK